MTRVLLISPNGGYIFFFMNLLVNRRFQHLIQRVLKEVYKPAFVQFYPSLYMPMYVSGYFTGIVVDCGYSKTEIIAVDCRSERLWRGCH